MSRPRSALDEFFHPSSASPVLDVLRASARLRDATAQGSDRSHGRVLSSEAPRRRGGAHPSGIWSEAIFGPLNDLRCARFGHILLPIGVVHPALAGAIGELLGLTPEGVRAVALQMAYVDGSELVPVDIDDEQQIWSDRVDDSWLGPHLEQSGLNYLKSRLAEAPPSPLRATLEAAGFSPTDLLVDAIPVVPPSDRPLCASDDPTILGPQLGRVNEAYLSLMERAERVSRLLELNAPLIVIATDIARMQARFELLHGALTGAPAPILDQRWRRAPDPDEGPPSSEPGGATFLASPRTESESESEAPIAALWIDDQRLLIQLPRAAFVIDKRDGRVLGEHPIAGLTARFTDEPGQRIVFLGRPGLDGDEQQDAVAVLSMDTPEGRWLDAYPQDLGSVTADDPSADDDEADPELLDLFDFRTGYAITIEVAAESPAKLFAISRGDRFVWLGGRGEAGGVIVSTETAVTHVALDAFPFDATQGPFLTATGALEDEPPAGAEADERAPAFVLTPERRFRFLNPDGVVAENTEQLFTLSFPRCAAAFSPRGDRLLVLTKEEGFIIEVGRRPRVEQRMDLRPLARRLAAMEEAPAQ